MSKLCVFSLIPPPFYHGIYIKDVNILDHLPDILPTEVKGNSSQWVACIVIFLRKSLEKNLYVARYILAVNSTIRGNSHFYT